MVKLELAGKFCCIISISFMWHNRSCLSGLFYNRHLKHIILNTMAVNFSEQDLSYLLKPHYDANFLQLVYSLPLITPDKLLEPKSSLSSTAGFQLNKNHRTAFRVEYESMDDFLRIAKLLDIMADTKVKFPRLL